MDKMSYNKIVEWLVTNNFQKKIKVKNVMEVWYNPTLPDVTVSLMFNTKNK